MPAGQASMHFANPFTFFIGDPFLERVKDNRTVRATDYDDGIGQKIFSDTKDMLDADVFDYNADGLKDVAISYQDGAIRILKNHGGTNPFKDMGMLLVVAPGIRETFVGDVDGNGWDDILVRTKNDKMVAYTNQ
ncbi:MAG: VCBS repeat-containing protein [Candidatus Peribacteria bacterium]|nr:MAG: VCBS repeat-containing protein [Candidatus Peribacteria bacterium]